jgi:hypothetical protein
MKNEFYDENLNGANSILNQQSFVSQILNHPFMYSYRDKNAYQAAVVKGIHCKFYSKEDCGKLQSLKISASLCKS